MTGTAAATMEPGVMSQAIQQAWDKLAGSSSSKGAFSSDTIDLDQCIKLTDMVAEMVGIPQTAILSEQGRAKFAELMQQYRGEIGGLTREEFNEFFQMATGKEFNSRILDQPKDQETQSDMSLDLSNAVMDTSTPLRGKRSVSAGATYRFQDGAANNNHNNNHSTVLGGNILEKETRSAKDVQMLNDQEDLLKRYESQVSELDSEKSRLNAELAKMRAQLRDLENRERRKDTHIQEIELNLSNTRQQLATKKRDSPPAAPPPPQPEPQVVYRENTNEINKLQAKLEQAEVDKLEYQQRIQDLTQQQQQQQQQQGTGADLDYNTAQQLYSALTKQKQLLAYYSDGLTVADSSYSNYTDNKPRQLDTTLLLWGAVALGLIYTVLFMAREGPWWHGTVVHGPASRFNAWVQPHPIS